jgi:hypothetical protein
VESAGSQYREHLRSFYGSATSPHSLPPY